MKKLIFFILLAGAGYLYYTNPTREAHIEALTEALTARQVIAEGAATPAMFRDLDYSSFFIGSSLKDTEKMTIVTSGYLGKVKVVDDQWKPKRLP